MQTVKIFCWRGLNFPKSIYISSLIYLLSPYMFLFSYTFLTALNTHTYIPRKHILTHMTTSILNQTDAAHCNLYISFFIYISKLFFFLFNYDSPIILTTHYTHIYTYKHAYVYTSLFVFKLYMLTSYYYIDIYIHTLSLLIKPKKSNAKWIFRRLKGIIESSVLWSPAT